MIKANDEIFELICLSECEYNSNEMQEFTLGFYSSQKLANEQKTICEKQAEEEVQSLQYRVEKHRIVK